jgi:hypothetical protein
MKHTAKQLDSRREPNRLVSVRPARRPHPVRCPHCTTTFDLFEAAWCGCATAPRSKVCRACSQCACDRPGYHDPRLWAVAPPAFEREGFERLFVAYV